MLPDSQSSAHRAQPPRSKTRWQPYPLASATFDTNTPKPSVAPSPLPSVTPLNINSNPLVLPKELITRDHGKQKYAIGLIDQAVKTLFEIWRPEDIPAVFVGPSKSPSLCNPPPSGSPPPSQSLVSTGAETDSALLPLKTFVHEVLKRSRTSGSIMQTALCYLEAVRSKVPEILCDEKLGVSSYFMPESAILPATEVELQMDRRLSNLEGSDSSMASDELLKTIRLTYEATDVCETSNMTLESTAKHSSTSPLPSPLLCPRRTFLASLILASKFSQDKCYSNRAWAKLSGLPPREIGRCERALGHALDWRLWVGKKALGFGPAGLSRAIARTQSESCITTAPSLREPSFPLSEPKGFEPQTRPNLEASSGSAWIGKGLRRCCTVPSETFTSSRLSLRRSDSVVDQSWVQDPYAYSDSSGSSTSSPDTPPLSSPSTSSNRTVQISPYDDGMFPPYSACQPRLNLDDSRFAPSGYSNSPATFLPDTMDSNLCYSNTGKIAAMQLQMSLAETISESLWGSRLSVTGSHLWHVDGGHLSLESAPVH